MKYRFIPEKKQEFLDGRTTKYIASKVGLSRQHICNILNCKTDTVEATCLLLINFWLSSKNINSLPDKYLCEFFRGV